MNILKKTLLASAVSAAAMLSASAASAADYGITGVGFIGDSANLTGTINGNPFNQNGVNTGLITLTTNTGAILPVFCVDLFHDINIGSYPPPGLPYTTGPLAFDSSNPATSPGVTGNPLSQPVTGAIQTLENLGAHYYTTGTGSNDIYAGLQGAIWELEYNTNGNSLTVDGGATVNPLIAADYAYGLANPASYALTLYPGAGGQAFGGTQGFVTASGPNVGEGLLGFAAMTALLIGVRYRGLLV